MIRHSLCALLAALSPFLVASQASAAFVEGFESETLSLLRTGDASSVTGDFFSPFATPPQGQRQLLLTTLATASDGGNFSGIDAVGMSALGSFLALEPGTLSSQGGDGDGSAVKLTIELQVGESITFQYQFLTAAVAGDGEDFAFLTLQLGSGAPLLVPFASISNATGASNSMLFDRQTGIVTFTSAPVQTPGIYTVGIGIVDAGDDTVQSGVLVDNVQVVPEPSAALLLLGGAVGMAGMRRRRG